MCRDVRRREWAPPFRGPVGLEKVRVRSSWAGTGGDLGAFPGAGSGQWAVVSRPWLVPQTDLVPLTQSYNFSLAS